jgi:hypothetical protein
MNTEIANKIIDDILDDTRERMGIGDELNQVEDSVIEEIKEAWRNIIYSHVGTD